MVANQLGCSQIGFLANDGSLSGHGSTTVCVVEDPNANEAPVLSGLPDKQFYENSGSHLNLFDLDNYASDADGDSLSFTITTQTQSAIVNCEIGSGNIIDCAVQNNKLGCSDVTVRVNDGRATDSDTFKVCVVEVPNTAPVWSTFGPYELYENSGFTNNVVDVDTKVSDAQNDALSISISSQSNTGVVSCSLDSHNNLDCTVVANQIGCSAIELSVSDSKLSATTTAQVCVERDISKNNAPIWTPIPTEYVYKNTGDNKNIVNIGSFVSDVEADPIGLSIVSQSNSVVVSCTLDSSANLDCVEVGVLGCSIVKIQANDGYDISNGSVQVCVIRDPNANEAPIADFNQIVMQQDEDPRVVATLAQNISDADGDALTLELVSQSNANIVDCSLASNTELTCEPQTSHYGTATLTFRIGDGRTTIIETMDVVVERNISRYTPTSPEVDREIDYIYISQFEVLNDNCGASGYGCDNIILLLNLRNNGDVDRESVRVAVTSFELGIHRTLGPFDLDEGDVFTRELVIPTFGQIEPGYHTIRLVITSLDGTKRIVHREIYLQE